MTKRPLPELKDYRAANDLSQAALAGQLGVRRVTVARWESGERRPSRQYAGEISKMTGLPVAEIVGVEL